MLPVTVQQAFAFAQQHHQAGRLAEAEGLYRQILAVAPQHLDALHFLGVIAAHTGRSEEGMEMIRRSIASDPRNSAYHDNLGTVFREQGRVEEALACSQRALALNPNEAATHNNLGNALRDVGRVAEAIACYERALTLAPDYADALNNWGMSLRSVGRLEEALAAHRRVLVLAPGCAQAHLGVGHALADLGSAREADAEYRRALVLRPGWADAHSAVLLNLHYLADVAAETMSAEHLRWDEAHARPLWQGLEPHANDPTTGRRLRVGYVSPDFRSHPVGYFIENLLASHDRAQVEVFCYSNSHRSDAVTTRLRAHASHWRTIMGQSDARTSALIREDEIDILVDLAGHTADNRLLVFARKPAPVQVTYLGYCDTTGLGTMDYRITDRHADPPGTTERFHTERLVRLPKCAWCYSPPETAPVVAPLPALQSDVLTFGSFNTLAKINDEVLALWGDILRRIPGSRLLLKSAALGEDRARQRIVEELARGGIASDRIEFSGWQPSLAAHLDTYRRVDIALDPFPYHGTTTTCEALWMGVPVVTLAGAHHAARVGASLLHAVGLDSLVAHDRLEYAEIAVRLACDLPLLARLRFTLRDRMKGSPLLDAPTFARCMEVAYREMWRAWCEKQAGVK